MKKIEPSREARPKLTLMEFQNRFRSEARRRVPDGKRLLQLGIPGPDSVSVLVVPRVSAATDDVTAWKIEGLPTGARAFISRGLAGNCRIDVTELAPATAYTLRLPDGGVVTARTAPAASLPAPARFLAYSCFSPWGDLGDGDVSVGNVHALHLLKARAAEASFAVAGGDQIYVDEGGWSTFTDERALISGFSADRFSYQPPEGPYFDFLYRLWFSIPPFDAALSTVPTAMTWDDHDIRDGWGSQDDETHESWSAYYDAAREYFLAWQMTRSPRYATRSESDVPLLTRQAAALGAGLDATRRPEQHFTFDWGTTTTVFVMDQRSHRNYVEHRAVSQTQLDDVKRWLDDAKRAGVSTCFVLVSPMPLTTEPLPRSQLVLPFRRDDVHDTWTDPGNLAQRDVLLRSLESHFTAHPEHRLIIVSGDLHYGQVRELSNRAGRIIGHEVISSGLCQSMFNSAKGDHDLPEVGLKARSLCAVRGPLFAELSVTPVEGNRPPDASIYFHVGALSEGPYGKLGALQGPTAGAPERVRLGAKPLSMAAPPAPWGDSTFVDPAAKTGRGNKDADGWSDPLP